MTTIESGILTFNRGFDGGDSEGKKSNWIFQLNDSDRLSLQA